MRSVEGWLLIILGFALAVASFAVEALSLLVGLVLAVVGIVLKDFFDRGWLPGFSPAIMGIPLMSADAAIG